MFNIGMVRNVLGEARQANYLWSIENGADHNSYNCPFCASAVIDPRGCQNPWCTANPSMPISAACELVAKSWIRAKDEYDRKRNHENAMKRIAEENDRRIRAWQDWTMAVRAKHGCLDCSNQYRNKIVRHRLECPKIRKVA